jgi:hypothetical protein
MPARLSGAPFADTSHLNLGADDGAECPDGSRDADLVEFRAVEVTHQATALANVVVVGLQVGIKAHALPSRGEGDHEAEVVQEPQRAVDGIERHRGHCRSDGLEERLGIRVLQAGGNFAEDLEALVRELDARLAGTRLEGLKPPSDHAGVHHQNEFLSARTHR